jgi:hypothetical protein
MSLTVSVHHVVGPDLRASVERAVRDVLEPLSQQEDWSVLVLRRQTGRGWDVAVRAPDGRWFGSLDAIEASAIRAMLDTAMHTILSARAVVA